jgi:hypothetical protein
MVPQKSKVGIILAILLILSLAGAVTGFYSFRKERLKTIALNEELKNLKVEKRIIEEKLAEAKKRINELNTQLQAERTQTSELKNELERAESEKNQFYSQIKNLQYQLRKQEKIKQEWEAKQAQAQEEIQKLQAQLQASKDESRVQLGKIVVGPKQAPEETPPGALEQPRIAPALEGKVLVVNQDYDFVVINLGSRDAIDVGNIFSVYQGDSYIGDIKVDKIRETISACGFTSKEIKDKIREGDKVIGK